MANTDTPAAAHTHRSPMEALREVRKRHGPLRNTHKEVQENLSPLNKLALAITTKVGTMGFFLAIFVWTVVWLGWNTLMPTSMRFDPGMGFVLYLFVCNVIQILLMPLIMVGQNLQGAHSEARAEHDLEVNVKAEQEIEVILQHLEHQNNILMQMVEKLGVDVREGLAKD
ncbi:MAG TPA: DUF1003 domain-containing protein [Caulobacteraceae bacterium]|jgi:uncharacterized membrane protein